ncbi:MAG: F0F1 ATP synthase subunit alpha [Ignavibacteriales bacterium]
MNDYVDELLKEKIVKIKESNNVYDIGKVIRVQDFIIEVKGLDSVSFFEKVNIADKAIGYVDSILPNSVIIAILKETNPVIVGDIVSSTGEEYKGSFSSQSIGRVIDMFGEDKIVGKMFEKLYKLNIENPNISLMDRGTVNRPLLTGISGIDLIYPIGKGQRQLIIGDKKTGKTQICLDTIVNQKGKNVICIYIAIGKTKKNIKEIYYDLLKNGAMGYTTIVAAFNDEKPPVLSLTPYFGLAMAELYMKKGYDVLVVIDDLKRHAEAYREISLISGKTPGRDAYPADIFYTHSRLLEKGCQHKNGASITILPIVETKGEDITDYISTNIISITDGQIVLSSKNFRNGEKPAIDYGLSVSRLGAAVQNKSVINLSAIVRRKLLSFLETRDIYEMANVDDMNEELRNMMIDGNKILDSLIQYKYSPRSIEENIKHFEFINEEKS